MLSLDVILLKKVLLCPSHQHIAKLLSSLATSREAGDGTCERTQLHGKASQVDILAVVHISPYERARQAQGNRKASQNRWVSWRGCDWL